MEESNDIINIYPNSQYLEIVVHSNLNYQWKDCNNNYRLVIINDVPIIAFHFENLAENFFIHLNWGGLRENRNNGWIDRQMIHLVLLYIEMPHTDQVKNKINIVLTMEDSDKLREACKQQVGQTKESVDASIDFIYETNFEEYEWLR